MPRTLTTRHVIPISGKDSLATAVVQKRRKPDLVYEYVFIDVGMELPETYKWLLGVEQKLGITLTRVGKSLENAIVHHAQLPSHLNRFCTRETKMKPYADWIVEGDPDEVVNYIGYRADEKERIPPSGVSRISDAHGIKVKEVYPLVEEGIDLAGVYSLLDAEKLTPPSFFWQRLYDAVYERCGPASQTWLDSIPPWTVSHLFSWRSRSNCYQCHYQRLYEWVGLLEHHPDLFAHAEVIERECGAAVSETRLAHDPTNLRVGKKDFHFHMDWPLPVIRKSAERIFNDRVTAVYRDVLDAREKPRKELDLLTTTSCGAYCGK